ncbi:MAG: endolytic transglycosylase MltG, partial [Gammaproteobacteria bacterium]|nr:endolytic transglycosylase MltG [Gammaproteobacteria bacterium]
YLITPGSTLAGLLDNMVAGKVVQHDITLIEGSSFRQLLETIHKAPIITKQLENLSDEEIMKRLGHAGEHPEGRFYPDTYYVSRGVTDTDLLNRAYTVMQQTLEAEWQRREDDLPFKSSYEALILASIVEKETAVAEERPLIAGLFINRLRKKMRLQTDPAVIYGIKNFDGNIRFRDLRNDTPYNTYTRNGLPPTPIAMPGRESINAVLHPDKTDYLYFVAYGDGSGRHVFSTNLKDHEKAVDQYQRKKR